MTAHLPSNRGFKGHNRIKIPPDPLFQIRFVRFAPGVEIHAKASQMSFKLRLLAATAGCAMLLPALAQADILSVYVAPKFELVTGTGEVYEKFQNKAGYGVEAGVEVLGIDLWGDLLVMGDQQFLSTINLGFDLSFGEEIRFTIGTYVGPIFYVFEQQEADTLNISDGQLKQLNDAGSAGVPIDASSLQQEYNKYSNEASDVNRLSLGLNLPRVRASLEYELLPVMYLGIQGSAGYHWVLSGEDVVADAKSKAIDDLVKEKGFNPDQANIMRDIVGARKLDENNLNGVNYSFGAFIKLEL